ncbi:hypothetical protein EG850_13055 [Gulosibacter macacae]|uniref:Uncharacterized protein n=1 Tax=Gulosibacter macacae TaxID=2488791 RepID=A0A3P3VXY9_9MICO|nr:hypothetical protein [Gulosibacter macacae]RRJ85543.1 hypothetical protein EG850_13055 [Gulosibacter macacae]
MFWRRYGGMSIMALLVATVLGVVVAIVLVLLPGGFTDPGAALSAVVFWATLGAIFGLVTGVVSVTGGLIAIAVGDRELRRAANVRIHSGTLGGALGAALPWALYIVSNYRGGPEDATVFLWLLIPLGLGAVCARTLVFRAEEKAGALTQ